MRRMPLLVVALTLSCRQVQPPPPRTVAWSQLAPHRVDAEQYGYVLKVDGRPYPLAHVHCDDKADADGFHCSAPLPLQMTVGTHGITLEVEGIASAPFQFTVAPAVPAPPTWPGR